MRNALLYHKQFVDAITAYLGGAAVGLYSYMASVDWFTVAGMLGGFVLFVARASVDIPKAIDYWRERRERKRK